MRTFLSKALALLLMIAILTAAYIPGITAKAASQPVRPFVAISWEQFYNTAVSNSPADITVSQHTDYLQAEVKNIASNASQRAINYYTEISASDGDAMLIRIVVRSVNADGTSGQMYISMGKRKSGNIAAVMKNTATVDIPGEWTEFFFPLEGVTGANGLNIRLGQKVQTIQVKDFEVINYGNTDLATLPTGCRSTNPVPTVQWNDYYANPSPNNVVITKPTQPGGLYPQFLRTEVQTVADNPTQRTINYSISSVAKDTPVLIRIVARSAGESGIMRLTLRNTTDRKEISSADYALTPVWTEFYIPLCLADYAPNRVIVRLGHQIQTVDIADFEMICFSGTALSSLPIGYRPLIEPAKTTHHFTSALTTDGSISSSAACQFLPSDLDMENGDMILFSLVVRGDAASRHIRLTAEFDGGSTVMEYAVPVQDTRINMPITAKGALKSFKIEALDGPVILTEAKVENRRGATQEDLLVESGMHMLEEEYEGHMLSQNGVGAGKTTDLVCSGNFAYSIGSGNLVITDLSDPDSPVVRGKLTGLGDTRQIDLCKSGTDVMVTARGYGVWVIDVSDPDNPRIRAHYDSVEMATGIDIEGDYAYISCRQYGVDVVDISNLDRPKHICILRTGEVQSCKVVDNILYAGLYSQHRVDMYDVSDPINSTLLGSTDLSGRGDGTAIYKKDGKVYLFAATGHHAVKNLSVTEPLSNLNYGQGNGMDIYDVTDPANPVWLSTSRTDGRFYSPSYDYWSVSLSTDESGKLYAYLSSSFNGIYVYDASSLNAPRRLAHIAIEIPKSSENYSALTSSTRTVAYPFDRNKLNWGAVGDIAAADGILYIAGITTDLIVMESEALFHNRLAQENTTAIVPSGDFYSFDGADLAGYTRYHTDSQIHAAALHGSYVFAAGGTNGILILDRDLKLQKQFTTPGTCYDVQVRGNVLYAAEGVSGLAAYTINAATLTELWRYNASGRAVKQVRLSETGKFAVLHVGSNRGEIVRLTDRVRMVHVTTGSQMYHHNVVNGVVGGRYMCFWANSTDERWYDFGENDSFDEPVLIRNFTPRCAMSGGIEAVGDLALSMTSSGYVLYNPSQVTDISSGLTVYKPGQNISGKPSEHLGALITTNRITGAVYIMDASDLTDPKLTKSFTVAGHPATAVYGPDAVYIPLGNQGILKFDTGKTNEELKFAAASVSLYADIAVNFKVDNSILEGTFTDPYVVFDFAGNKQQVRLQEVQDGYAVFRFRDIGPHLMGETITATLYATKDGILCQGETKAYSIAQYCYNTLNRYNTDYYRELHTLLVDLLNYGAMAQLYVNPSTPAEQLVTAGLTQQQKAWGTPTDSNPALMDIRSESALTEATVAWVGGGLSLQESVALRLRFAAESTEGLSVRFTLDGNTFTVTDFVPAEDKSGEFYVYLRDMNASHMRAAVKATVYRDGQPVSNTLTYSVASYIANHANDTDAQLAQLVKAIIRYGDAAHSYVN